MVMLSVVIGVAVNWDGRPELQVVICGPLRDWAVLFGEAA